MAHTTRGGASATLGPITELACLNVCAGVCVCERGRVGCVCGEGGWEWGRDTLGDT